MDQLSLVDVKNDPNVYQINDRKQSGPKTPASEYSHASISLPANTDTLRELIVYRASTLSQDYKLTTPDKTPVYYVVNSTFTRGTPDVTLHGPPATKEGLVLGAGRFSITTTSVQVAFGDPQSQNCEWETLEKKHRFNHSTYGFSVKMPFQSENSSQAAAERRCFTWKRSHGQAVAGGAKYSKRNFKLVDNKTDEVVAVFLASKSWMERGKFQFRRNWGSEWEIVVLVTGLTLMEKARRRDHPRASAGGAGGSSG